MSFTSSDPRQHPPTDIHHFIWHVSWHIFLHSPTFYPPNKLIIIWHSIWHVIYHSVRAPQAPQSLQSRDSPPSPRESQQERGFFFRDPFNWPGTKLAEALRSLPNIVWHGHSAAGCPAGVPKCWRGRKKRNPKMSPDPTIEFFGKLHLFMCFCTAQQESLSFRWLLSLPASRRWLSADYGGIFCALCVCLSVCTYVM